MPSHDNENKGDRPPNKPASNVQKPPPKSRTPHSSKETEARNGVANQKNKQDEQRIIEIGKIPKIDIIEGVEANNIAGQANSIAKAANSLTKWSIGVNAVLMVCTVILAVYAIVQVSTSKSAAIIAQKTLDTTRKYDSITLANQEASDRKADDTAKSKYQREVNLYNLQKDFYTKSKQGIDSQISAIKTSQKQFDVANSPYFQVVPDDIPEALTVGKPIILNYHIDNLGLYPAKTISGVQGCSIRFYVPKIEDVERGSKGNIIPANIYISREKSYKGVVELSPFATKEEVDNIKSGKWKMYFVGWIRFRNLANQKEKTYKWVVDIEKPLKGEIRFVYFTNDNVDGFNIK